MSAAGRGRTDVGKDSLACYWEESRRPSNTDQGRRFVGADFTGVLLDAEIKISMESRGRAGLAKLHSAISGFSA